MTDSASRRRGLSFAQHATTMLFPHFVGDACPREPGLMRTGLVELIE